MIDLTKALFFDIETHRVEDYSNLSPALRKSFERHYWDPDTYPTAEEHYNEVAGLHAEFSHVICVVFGYEDHYTHEFKTMSVYGIDEIKLLDDARKIFDAFKKNGFYLVGHNINGCDIPYMIKRYIINKKVVPEMLNTYGLRPWDKNDIDTMEFWKFGSFSRVSLEVVCATLGIDCKTDEIGGDNLYQYDIKEVPFDQLVHYCTEDVVSNYRMFKTILNYYRC